MLEDLQILFEDNQIIVVLKPAGVPSQEDSTGVDDMLTIVKNYIKIHAEKKGNVFLGLVHRLDRPTGGVMVFAKTSKSASRLSAQIQSGEFEKTYFAVVCGIPKERKGKLVHYLKKDTMTNNVMIVPQLTEDSKRAELDYEVLDIKNDYSLVKIKLLTGRSHQARVQMRSLGTPIYADARYGTKANADLNLFAVELKFNHPVSGEKMVFRAYPPEAAKMWNVFNVDQFLRIR